jgi:GAF domain-containing protein/CheY-like chemotaxis protein/anti-sigma regulatory factor (Ser/Thr protein kinase)
VTAPSDRLRQIADLARSVSSALELEAVFDRMTGAVASLRPDIGCVIRLVDVEAGGYRLAATGGAAAEGFSPLVPFGEGLTHAVAEGRRPLLVLSGPDDPRAARESWAAAGPLSVYYGVPIEAGGEVLAVLSVLFPAGGPPTDDDREAIDLMAGLAAVAIRNARLFAESEARRQAAESLAEVSRVLVQTLDLDLIADRIAGSACRLLGASASALFRLDPESGDLVALAVAGTPGPGYARGAVARRGRGPLGLAVLERRPVATQDVVNDPRVELSPEWRARLEGMPDRAILAVPLVARDRVIGAFTIRHRTGRVYRSSEVRLIQAFADQAAVALENARLYAEAARRRHEAEELARLARMLTESLDLTSVGRRVVDSVLPLFRVPSSGLFLLEADGSLRAVAWGGRAREHFEAGQVFPAGVGIMGRAVAIGVAVWSRDVLTEPGLVLSEDLHRRIVATGHHATLAIPLRAKGQPIGVLSITDARARSFSDEEVTLLQTFADQAAGAIENARLYREAQAAYDALSRAQAQLVRGETLRAVGELASGAAHHLNNLLAIVVGRVQLLLPRVEAPEIRRPLEIVERAALESAEVVRRLNVFSRARPTASVESVDLNAIATEVLELTRPRWSDEPQARGATIDAVLEPGPVPAIAADAAALREVLVNLVLNAVEAMPNSGAITISTWADDDWVHCSISDTGVGMSEELQRRALEPFFTTKGVKSTGLGLSVNHGIIRHHGGDLTIDSAEGRGTTVTFTLPVVAGPAPGPATPGPEAPTVPRRILVIDDEPEVRRAMSELLAEDGHQVIEATGGRDALARLDAGLVVDLVLTDLGMPDMTGREVARAIKARRPALPIGLVTGWGENALDAREEPGIAFVLPKPVTQTALRATMAQTRPWTG